MYTYIYKQTDIDRHAYKHTNIRPCSQAYMPACITRPRTSNLNIDMLQVLGEAFSSNCQKIPTCFGPGCWTDGVHV